MQRSFQPDEKPKTASNPSWKAQKRNLSAHLLQANTDEYTFVLKSLLKAEHHVKMCNKGTLLISSSE